ncbi:unnamed protein product [Bathycoccus prasinos]
MNSNISSLQPPQSLKILGCFVGVVGSLLVYGLLQERIMTRPYETSVSGQEYFKFSVFLVLSNRLLSCLMALGVLVYSRGNLKPIAGIHRYCAVSVSNVVATYCQYEALKYVSFPVQTLGKCAKMIPVMIWGYLITQRRYFTQDYLSAAGVTLGCAMFALYGDVSSNAAKDHGKGEKDTSVYGVGLMLGYLCFDGFTSTFQDKLFKGYQMEMYNQMMWVNLCSACISALWLFSDSVFFNALAFVGRHPAVLKDICTLSVAAMLGQLSILYTIRAFGALLFATIMTTRQFLSILLSCLIFTHPLTFEQWLGTGMVFGSLYYQAHSKNKTLKNMASSGANEIRELKATATAEKKIIV